MNVNRNEQILECIKSYMLAHNYPPSVRDICEMVGIKSTSTVFAHLQQMRSAGMIDFEDTIPRTITVTGVEYREVG